MKKKSTKSKAKSPRVHKPTKDETIASYAKANGIAQGRIDQMIEEDRRLRTVFSELLGSYSYEEYSYSMMRSNRRKTLDVLTWEGIAFKMGELKADADYSIMVGKMSELNQEISKLSEKNDRLEHPEKYEND